MANKRRYFNNPSYSLLQQKVALSVAYKNASCSIDNKKNELLWSGKIKPTALSKEYNVILTYRLGNSPKVWVVGDELEKLDDIKKRILIISGDEDHCFISGAKALVDRVKTTEIQIIEKCGHVCSIEKWGDFNSMALNFLNV